MAMTEDRDITNAINTARKEAKEEGMERGIAEGMEKGLAEGMEKAHYETARKMKAKGFDSKEIAELTGLTEQETRMVDGNIQFALDLMRKTCKGQPGNKQQLCHSLIA